MATVDDIYQECRHKMEVTLHALRHEFNGLRTGRASAALLDRVMVDAYGSTLPLNQVATISVPDAATLQIKPFDKNVIGAIEKGISRTDLGLTPNNDGQTIRLVIPPLTRERREELVKTAKHEAENARVALRNVRREANDHVKRLKTNGDITEDMEKLAHDEVQKITDGFMAKLEEELKKKEAEILE
ncbi:MAG TPA: ribosome recycling factor [bacterium]|nr:ribosome recycling factor [bacterium]